MKSPSIGSCMSLLVTVGRQNLLSGHVTFYVWVISLQFDKLKRDEVSVESSLHQLSRSAFLKLSYGSGPQVLKLSS